MMPGTRLPRDSSAGWLIHAPAKLNVYLEVLPKRPDGYHGIQTLMCPVRLGDTLLIRPTDPDGGQVSIEVRSALPPGVCGPVPTDESNLVARALESVWNASGIRPSCHVTITKRIPTQAGLGGGSSDAAAALVAANHIWRLGRSPEQLLDIAATIGSDVPGLLSGRPVWCQGRGEVVSRAGVPAGLPVVIAKQEEGLPTSEVFGLCQPARSVAASGPPNRLVSALRSGKPEEIVDTMTNRLQEAALRVAQSVERLQGLFSRLPLVTHQLTGSGSAYFGVCRSWRQALKAAAWLRSQRVPWVTATTTC